MTNNPKTNGQLYVLGDYDALRKQKKLESPHDRIQRVVKRRLGESLVAPTTNFLERKKQNEGKPKQSQTGPVEIDETPCFEKMHIDASYEDWQNRYANFLQFFYGDEMEFYDNKMEHVYGPIFDYFGDLLFEIATDSEKGLEVTERLHNFIKLPNGKLKGDIGIYIFLTKNYLTSDLLTDEIAECYLAWYNENKKKNKVGKLLATHLSKFLPIVYSLARDVKLFKYRNEMDEGYEESEEDDYE